jgi:hypothetical protein
LATDVEIGSSQRVEIGYVCSHGHYAFYADPEGTSCGSKRVAGVYAERDPGVEFYGPYEAADETGFVYFSSCGYEEDEYVENIKQAEASLAEKIAAWRQS